MVMFKMMVLMKVMVVLMVMVMVVLMVMVMVMSMTVQVVVSQESGVTDENLRGAKVKLQLSILRYFCFKIVINIIVNANTTDDQGFTAICIFVNKKIEARQVPILVENGNRVS